MTTHNEPLRFQVARDYLAAVRDMGDADLLASARRYFVALGDRSKPCTDGDRANYRDWLANH